ncbi:helix-turn-helix domain-containing protein [Chitinophaga alhagiae]|uniref:helix-turn-helix domain-containing protein n=1 Tax=Chitinophaga alhagiae TaxID=2203219 RepID=UPI000E5B5AF2|nr:helix-turn-helix transcriptional regulator [Chitinophaga alhagiae]
MATILETVGRNMCRIRALQRISAITFAQSAKISTEKLEEIEEGKVNITIVNLQEFADLLHVTIFELLVPTSNEIQPHILN